jgi:hypothetical protein
MLDTKPLTNYTASDEKSNACNAGILPALMIKMKSKSKIKSVRNILFSLVSDVSEERRA